jgi:GT2 family glycosyltransferase
MSTSAEPDDRGPAEACAGARVFVVIVTYQAGPWIEQCLGSLLACNELPTIVVVDNCSQDATCSIIVSKFPEVRLLRSEVNLGFGRGNNVGIEHALSAGAEYVFLLNQDAYVSMTAIGQMRSYMDAHPGVGVVSPLHCASTGLADERTMVGYVAKYFTRYVIDAADANIGVAYEGRGVNAAAWFVRAETFRRWGGFDPLFFMYGEDDDLLTRWQFHGVRFHLLPAARVVHVRESSPGPKRGPLAEIRHRARRRRSTLLTRVKRPGYSLPHALSVWLAEGLLEPIQLFPMRRDAMTCVADLLAALTLLFELSRVRSHQHLTSASGPHFLRQLQSNGAATLRD